MSLTVARFLKGTAWAVFVATGLLGFLVDIAITARAAGFWGVVLGFSILPVTFTAAPWYALVVWHNWYPLLIEYGGWAAAAVLYVLGSCIEERRPQTTRRSSGEEDRMGYLASEEEATTESEGTANS